MLILIWIITSLLVFSIVILVHEWWHFKFARIFWVKVEEFWLWLPPKARRIFTDKKGTIYTLNWLPLWWFVRLKWENIHTFNLYDHKKNLYNNETLETAIQQKKDIFDFEWEKINEHDAQEILIKLQDNFSNDSLLTKPYWQQAIIILAWVFMNFVLAIFLFSVLFFIGVSPIWINDKIETNIHLKLIPSPQEAIEIWLITQNTGVYLLPIADGIAKKWWIHDYDLAVKINQQEIKNHETLKNIISWSPNKEIMLELKRSKDNCDIIKNVNCTFENIKIKLTPNGDGKIGSYLIPNTEINKDFKYKYWFIDSIKYGTIETYGQIILTFKWIKSLIVKIVNPETPKERTEAIAQVSGPIGIVHFMTNTISNGIVFIVIIWAMISINLWVFNLLPIPALDGWRFLFIFINGVIQKIFGKKAISEKFEGWLHIGFFVFLIALSLLIAYNDINKIINN